MAGRPILFSAVLTILALAAILVGCSSDPPAHLPENVTAAIVYDNHHDRWHAAAIVAGDRSRSSLRVLCLTEPGKPDEFASHTHAGINIDASPGVGLEGETTWSGSIRPSEITDPDSVWGREWVWLIDGQPWEGGRWSMSTNTSPANLVAANEEVESAFFEDLKRAKSAELIGSKDEADDIRIAFDLTLLFSTPVQFAIDDCDEDVIEQRTGDYHSAYAYWPPDLELHSITLMEDDAVAERTVIISCSPKLWTDDDAPAWIRETEGGTYAAVGLFGFLDDSDDSHDSHDQTDTSMVEAATVSWADSDGEEGTAVWDVRSNSLYSPSARESLRFIDALRTSDELTLTVEAGDADPVEMTLDGAALFAKPLGAELDTCIREYAEFNG